VGSVRAARGSIEAALLDQPLLQTAVELEGKSDAKALAEAMKKLSPPSFPSDLVAVNDSSLSLAQVRVMGAGACFVATPNVYVRSESLDLRPDGTLVSRTAVDVARHELAVIAEPTRAWRARLLRGLVASDMEGRGLGAPGQPGVGAARVLREAGRAHGPLAVDRRESDLSAVQAPADAKAVMASELKDGVTLLVAKKPVEVAGGARTAWWRVTPGGDVIAVGEDGRGQAGGEGGMILTDVSIPQVKNCMIFVACFNKGVAGGGAMVETAAGCWAKQVKDAVKETLDSALEEFIGDPLFRSGGRGRRRRCGGGGAGGRELPGIVQAGEGGAGRAPEGDEAGRRRGPGPDRPGSRRE